MRYVLLDRVTLLEPPVREGGCDDLHAMLVALDGARFERAVRPGDRIELEAEALHASESGGKVRVSASVDGQRVTGTELTLAVVPVTHAGLVAQRRELLEIWLRHQDDRP